MLPAALILVFLTTSHSFSESIGENHNRDPYHDFNRMLDSAITAFYQTDWEEARTLFSQLQKSDEKDPRTYFFEAMVPFWKYFFAGETSDAAEQFLDKSETAIRVGQNRIKTDPEDTTTVLMMGGLYGYRGLVAASERHYRTAVQSGASGFSYTRRLMSMSADNPDVLIGQGMFHYMMGTIPREARWLTRLVGLTGNRDVGLKMLEEAATLDSHTSTDARMILAYLYHQEEQYEEALRVVAPLTEKWPDNIIFRYFYALSLEKAGEQDKAMSQYRMVVHRNHPELQALVAKGRERLETLTASAE